jgi:hypothetical protein
LFWSCLLWYCQNWSFCSVFPWLFMAFCVSKWTSM